MPIIAKAEGGNGGSFTPHPEGQYGAVCVDVHDLGLVEVTWQGTTKKQHKVDIYFYCGEDKIENGKVATYENGQQVHLMVRERLTLSLHPQSRMRGFLEAWRGKKFTEDEEKGFDVEALIGAPAFIQVSHNKVGDKTYANIDTIMRLPKQMTAPAIPSDYTRQCERPAQDAKPQQQATTSDWGTPASTPAPAYAGYAGAPDDDDLPF